MDVIVDVNDDSRKIAKRFQGTYHDASKVNMNRILSTDEPDWASLYPINPAKNIPVGLLSPRMACKLYYDGIFILKKTEENEKYLQDRIPEVCHKFYKKKQWRKQFIEGCRRVLSRVAKGLSFNPNCTAEEVFIHVILRDTFDLGWRRIAEHVDDLPETDRDRDFSRVLRLGANDEVGLLYRFSADEVNPKDAKNQSKLMDIKAWFKAYQFDNMHYNDHVLVDGAV